MIRKKSKPAFLKVEHFLKKYQISISIVVPTLFSTIAIIVSLNANNLAKKEFEKNKIPAWDYKINNEGFGNLRTLQIISLKSGIHLESFDVVTYPTGQPPPAHKFNRV